MPFFRVYSWIMLVILFGPLAAVLLLSGQVQGNFGEAVLMSLIGGGFFAFWGAIPVLFVLALVKSAFRL